MLYLTFSGVQKKERIFKRRSSDFYTSQRSTKIDWDVSVKWRSGDDQGPGHAQFWGHGSKSPGAEVSPVTRRHGSGVIQYWQASQKLDCTKKDRADAAWKTSAAHGKELECGTGGAVQSRQQELLVPGISGARPQEEIECGYNCGCSCC